MSRLTEFALSKRSVTLLLAAAVFLGGIYSWGQLKQELLPDIQLPVLFIFTADPGASDPAEKLAPFTTAVTTGVGPGGGTTGVTCEKSRCWTKMA